MHRINLAMLIDDESIDQRQFLRVMNETGVAKSVKVFTYADEALKHLIENPDVVVDVLFLDINMPRMNGFEFLERATEKLGPDFARVIVAMLTTSLDPKDRNRAMKFDAVRSFLNKPLTPEMIDEVVEMLDAA